MGKTDEPIRCDVLVVGGGSAGIAAAVSAARFGARVTLLEKYGLLGGLATTAQVGTLCGLPPDTLATGRSFTGIPFVREWIDALAEASGTQITDVPGGLRVLPFDSWAFRCLADELVAGQSEVTPLLHATLTSATVGRVCRAPGTGRPGGIIQARALIWNRLISLEAKAMVDCTGEATAIHLAEGKVVEDRAPQPPGVVFTVAGAEETLQELGARLSTLREIHRAATAGRLSPDCATASFVPGSLREGHVAIKLSLPHAPSNTPWRQITEWEVRARRRVQELADFLRQELPAFHKARLGRMFTQVGPRTGRHAQGRATLSETDVLDCRKYEDGVAWGTWPVEVWGQEASPRLTRLPEGEYYEIPLGCLQAADCECVWMAGRCLSAAPQALASARVIGTAMSTGWAAGAAAAHQASGRPLADAIAFLRGRGREAESQVSMEQTD